MYDASTTANDLTNTAPVSFSEMAKAPPALTAASIRTAIESWDDLRPVQQAALLTAVNHAEKIVSFAAAGLGGHAPWSCEGLNRILWARPHLAYGLTKDAFRNMLSGLRTVLIRLGAHADSGYGKNRLSSEWQMLYDRLPTVERQRGLVRLLRFLTLEGITPVTISAKTIDRFDSWCRTDILYDDPSGLSRRAAGNWKFARDNVAGWPQVDLQRTGMRDHYALSWEAYPASFSADVEQYLTGLAASPINRLRTNNPFAALAAAEKRMPAGTKSPRSVRRALSPRTIETRRWQIKVAATALAQSGVAIDTITSLTSLVTPVDRVAIILGFHEARLQKQKREDGEEIPDGFLKSSKLLGIAEILRQISKFVAKLPDADMEELNEYVAAVAPEQQLQMSEKNAVRLKVLFTERVCTRLLHLPVYWIKQASLPQVPTREAALTAMYAAALEILSFLPLRRENLLQLKLDVHLRRPSPNALINEIAIPSHMVKNRAAINWPVEGASAKMLEVYIRTYRPLLAAFGNTYLFPNLSDGARNECEFGHEFSTRVSETIGAEFNCHLMRHFAVVRYLRANPGGYEVAAHILGHKNPDTTRKFYCGLELDAAARHANSTLTEARQATKLIALGSFHKKPPRAGHDGMGGR